MEETIVKFEKYHGAGNDFVMIDDTKDLLDGILKDPKFVQKICTRRFGIGSDGMVVIKSHDDYDFEVSYYNADGYPGSLCGNGCRCAVKFVHNSGIVRKRELNFIACDGLHTAKVLDDGTVMVKFTDIFKMEVISDDEYFINTGSPHHVIFVDSLDMDIVAKAELINKIMKYEQMGGTNVMFVLKTPNQNGEFEARSYERGLWRESLACGTGAVAIAMSLTVRNKVASQNNLEYQIKFPGGLLKITYDYSSPTSFTNVWLKGPTTKVFDGKYKIC
jgi:diaminopimelate epimerase